MAESAKKPDLFGGGLGILVFLGGIGLLVLTFSLAYGMFSVPQSQALGIEKDKAVDLAMAGGSFAGLIVRVLLLLVMGAVGSMVANRGIKLYVESRSAPKA